MGNFVQYLQYMDAGWLILASGKYSRTSIGEVKESCVVVDKIRFDYV